MKKNTNFRVKNYAGPILLLMLLVIGAIWSNAGWMQSEVAVPAPLAQIPLPPAASTAPNSATGPYDTTQAAMLMQENINQVIAMVRPAVVAVMRPEKTADPAPNPDLTYLDSYQTPAGPMGSGVIIDPRGYVLTTFQTVGNSQRLQVILFSGNTRHYAATVIAVDPGTDLALLQIEAQSVFPTVILGNSDLLEVGDIVFAIGSPFGFARTVTMGIVSSGRRQLNIGGIRYPDMIQTDAAVNEGNDGGPLINIKGQIVGINMAAFMPDHQFAGIGFAIPIKDALNFVHAHSGGRGPV
jgi:serine protease Do